MPAHPPPYDSWHLLLLSCSTPASFRLILAPTSIERFVHLYMSRLLDFHTAFLKQMNQSKQAVGVPCSLDSCPNSTISLVRVLFPVSIFLRSINTFLCTPLAYGQYHRRWSVVSAFHRQVSLGQYGWFPCPRVTLTTLGVLSGPPENSCLYAPSADLHRRSSPTQPGRCHQGVRPHVTVSPRLIEAISEQAWLMIGSQLTRNRTQAYL